MNARQAFENHELERQPVTKTRATGTPSTVAPVPSTRRKDGIPGPFEGIREATPPYRFGWEEMMETLNQRANNDGPTLRRIQPRVR